MSTGEYAVRKESEVRVCIDARLGNEQPGGVEQVVIGLASAFSQLDGGSEKYLFLVDQATRERLSPYIAGNSSLLQAGGLTWRGYAAHRLRKVPGVRGVHRALASHMLFPALAPSDGTIEAAEVDLVHFVTGAGFKTRVPSLYSNHDLQHVHLPKLFSANQRAFRDATYRVLAEQAKKIVVMTQWGARDVARNLQVPRQKLAIVPWASMLGVYGPPSDSDIRQVKAQYSLPADFALYPAQTWPHKNHLELINALAELRERDLHIPLVSIGHKNDFYSVVEARVRQCGIEDNVQFLGYVPTNHVNALYRLSKCVIFPSLFEGWGLPVCEALSAGVPVACSDLPTLREYAGDACQWFDPASPTSIANSLAQVWTDETRRRELVGLGQAVSKVHNWARTARTLRALYREAVGAQLAAADLRLIRETAVDDDAPKRRIT